MLRTIAGLLIAAMAAFLTQTAQALPVTFEAFLDGPSEAPPNASPGTGHATVIFDIDLHSMIVEVAFGDLIGTTTAAHIHCCVAPPAAIGVATQVPFFVGFPIGVTGGSYAHTFDTTLAASFNPAFVTANGGTVASAEAALYAGLLAGEAYFNIHTSSFPGGEIRGFFATVPEPATLGLFVLGLAGLGLARRRRYPAGAMPGPAR